MPRFYGCPTETSWAHQRRPTDSGKATQRWSPNYPGKFLAKHSRPMELQQGTRGLSEGLEGQCWQRRQCQKPSTTCMAVTASNPIGTTRAVKKTFSLLSRPKQQLDAGREKAMCGCQTFGSSCKWKDAVWSSPYSVKTSLSSTTMLPHCPVRGTVRTSPRCFWQVRTDVNKVHDQPQSRPFLSDRLVQVWVHQTSR